MKTILAAATALIFGAGALVTAAPAQAADPVVFTVGILTDVDSLNPFTGIVAEAYEVYQLQYPTLTVAAPTDFAPEPSIAESWEESPDHTTWTFHLRPNLVWSDGVPMTSADVVYTFNRIMNGRYEKTNYGSYVRNITAVTAPDANTVVMKVKAPSPIMLRLAVYILPEHVWKDIDAKSVKSFANEPTDGQPLVGGGPFLVTERRTGQFIRMAANDTYFAGRPKIDELVFRIYNNADALGQALKKGEVDFAEGLTADVFTSLEGAEGITTYPAQYSGFNELAFNTGAALTDGTPIGDGNPHLKDPQVRRAISHAIDRQQLVDKVLDGYGTPGSTIIPPIYTTLHSDPGTLGYDPALANSILDDAGYPMGDNNVRVGPDGKPMIYRLFIRSDSDTSVKSGEYLKSYLAAIGIQADIKPVTEDALYEIVGNGTYDMMEWGWVVEPDPDYQLSTFTCDKRSYKDGDQIFADLSDSFYCNPAYDALYAKQSELTDPAARAEVVQQMQHVLYDDAPYVVEYYYDNLEAYRSDRFTGFVPQPTGNGALLFQYGTHSYTNITPISDPADQSAAPAPSGSASASSAPTPSSESGGVATGILLLILVGVFVLIVIVAIALLRRRSSSADERE